MAEARSISIKDVIAVLEREPQMLKSTLIYRLYEKLSADAAGEWSDQLLVKDAILIVEMDLQLSHPLYTKDGANVLYILFNCSKCITRFIGTAAVDFHFIL